MYGFRRSCLSWMAKGDESCALSSFAASRSPLSTMSYPAKIIVLLVITKSAHLARMIPRKRRISLVSIYSESEWTASDLQSVRNYSWNAQILYSAYIVNLASFEFALFASFQERVSMSKNYYRNFIFFIDDCKTGKMIGVKCKLNVLSEINIILIFCIQSKIFYIIVYNLKN